MKKNLIPCGLVLLFFTLTACQEKQQTTSDNPITVETMSILQKNIPVTVNSFGYLSAYKDVDIKAQVSGQITKIYFKEGSFVNKDELLISIDDSSYKANLTISEATLLQDIEDFKYQQYVFEKDKTLFEKGSLSRQEYQRMQTALLQAEARIKADQARVDLDKINLNYCSIKAPVSGIVGYIKVDEGNIITSSSDVICNIKQVDPLFVNFTVSEKNLFRIQNALEKDSKVPLTVFLKEQNLESQAKSAGYKGYLDFLNNQAQLNSGTLDLKGVLPNPERKLLPGLFVNVELNVGEIQNALMIPEQGLLLDNNTYNFFVLSKDSTAQKITVNVIFNRDGYCIALPDASSLKPGDRIIVSNLMDIIPGTKVIADSSSPVKENAQTEVK